MKKRIVLLALASILFASELSNKEADRVNCPAQKKEEKIKETRVETEKSKDWKVFIKALVEVESKGDSKCIGVDNDAGILQITPVYVEECNRLIGYDRWSLDDRFEMDKSLEMFIFMNICKNPDFDVLKAIKIHNPNAPESYEEKVLKVIKKIKHGHEIHKWK